MTSESKRVYPNDNLGSHILEYMGKISASEKAEYEAKGYETSALVGKEGAYVSLKISLPKKCTFCKKPTTLLL